MSSSQKEGGMLAACHSSLLVHCLDGSTGSTVGCTDGGGGGRCVPVGAGREDVVASEVVARESEVVHAQGAVGLLDGAEVAGDGAVEANMAVRGAAEVTAEEAERGVELLKHYSLSFHLADLLGDNA